MVGYMCRPFDNCTRYCYDSPNCTQSAKAPPNKQVYLHAVNYTEASLDRPHSFRCCASSIRLKDCEWLDVKDSFVVDENHTISDIRILEKRSAKRLSVQQCLIDSNAGSINTAVCFADLCTENGYCTGQHIPNPNAPTPPHYVTIDYSEANPYGYMTMAVLAVLAVIPNHCDKLTLPPNVQPIQYSSLNALGLPNINSIATAKCVSGYFFPSGSSNMTAKCKSDGHFVPATIPECKQGCPMPTTPNGVYSKASLPCSAAAVCPDTSETLLTCNSGYLVSTQPGFTVSPAVCKNTVFAPTHTCVGTCQLFQLPAGASYSGSIIASPPAPLPTKFVTDGSTTSAKCPAGSYFQFTAADGSQQFTGLNMLTLACDAATSTTSTKEVEDGTVRKSSDTPTCVKVCSLFHLPTGATFAGTVTTSPPAVPPVPLVKDGSTATASCPVGSAFQYTVAGGASIFSGLNTLTLACDAATSTTSTKVSQDGTVLQDTDTPTCVVACSLHEVITIGEIPPKNSTLFALVTSSQRYNPPVAPGATHLLPTTTFSIDCLPPYVVVDRPTATSQTIICLTDGTWSAPILSCVCNNPVTTSCTSIALNSMCCSYRFANFIFTHGCNPRGGCGDCANMNDPCNSGFGPCCSGQECISSDYGLICPPTEKYHFCDTDAHRCAPGLKCTRLYYAQLAVHIGVAFRLMLVNVVFYVW